MILVVGIPSEPPIERVWRAGIAAGMRVVLWNPRDAEQMEIKWDPGTSGSLRIGATTYALESFTGVYLRPMGANQLPEFSGAPETSERRRKFDTLHALLFAWCEFSAATIVNRVSAMGSNTSKPYQMARIRQFFDVPDSLVTSDPEAARAFISRHGRVICKSVSGTRSTVFAVEHEDLARLESIRWCPTQFQEYIEGTDIRVHIVGDEVFATEIRTNTVDYRYAARNPEGWIKVEATRLDEGTENRCRALTDKLGLVMSGIDLRVCTDGRVVCFEVNTSPGFSYYEEHTGQPISTAIVRTLRETRRVL